jgi:putative hydrolase of the HAD superfamily
VSRRLAAALFDLGGVIVDSPFHLFAREEERAGLAPGTLRRAVAGAGEDGAWARLERGELTLDAFVPTFSNELAERGIVVDVAGLMDALGRLRVRDDMVAAVRRARSRVRTGLLTNNWRQAPMRSTVAELLALFDVVVESHVEGVRKPDPAIYELACARLGVPPEQVVFFDDLGSNLKPARAMGMTTIKVEDGAAAVAALDEVLAAV